jgi:hypothetical protein
MGLIHHSTGQTDASMRQCDNKENSKKTAPANAKNMENQPGKLTNE